jgi:hypothetical protein
MQFLTIDGEVPSSLVINNRLFQVENIYRPGNPARVVEEAVVVGAYYDDSRSVTN